MNKLIAKPQKKIDDDLLFSALKLLQEVIIITDINGTIEFKSSNIFQILNLSSNLTNKLNNIQQIFPQFHLKCLDKIKNSLHINQTETFIFNQDQVIWLSVKIKYIQYNSVHRFIYLINNISYQKKLEAEIKQSQKIYADLADNLPIGIFRLDYQGNCIYANQKTLSLLKNSTEKPLINLWLDHVFQEDQPFVFDKLAGSLRNIHKESFEYRYQINPDEIKWFKTEIIPEIHPEEETYFIGTILDITAQKQAELELKQSLKNLYDFKYAIDQASILAITDSQGIITYVNEQFCQISQYSAQELIGKTHKIVNSGFHSQQFFEELWQTINQGKIWRGEIKNKAKNGSFYWVDTTIIPFLDNRGKIRQFLAIRTNITLKKQVQQSLLESEAKFRATFESASIGIANIGTDGSWLRVNQKLCDIVGYSVEELMKLTFQDITYPDDLETDLGFVNDCLAEKISTYSMEKRYIKKNGEIIWILLTVTLLRDENNLPLYFISIVQDINHEKQIEEELKLSEFRFRNAFENAPFPMMIHAEDGEVIKINQVWSEITGYHHEAISTIDKWTEKAYGHKMNLVKEDIDKLYQLEGRVDEGEYEITTIEGKKRTWYFRSTSLGKSKDNRRLVMSIAIDITQRKKAEESYIKLNQYLEVIVKERTIELEQSQQFLTLIINNIPQRIAWKTINSIYLGCNQSFAESMGYQNSEEIIGKTDKDLLDNQKEIELTQEWDRWVMEYNHPRYHQIKKRVIQDKKIWIDQSLIPLHNIVGKVIGILVTYEDITERKETEIALRKSEARYRRLIDTSVEGIWMIDKENKTTYVNQKMSELLGYSYEEMIGKVLFDFMDKEGEKIAKKNVKRRRQGIKEQHDFQFIRKDGSSLWTIVSTSPILDENGNYEGALGMITDISDRKKIEEKLKYSEERFKIALQNSPIVVFNQDLDLKYTWIYNPALGFQAEEVIGLTDADIFNAEDYVILTKIKKQVIDTGIGTRQEVIIDDQGQMKCYDLTVEPLLNLEGKIIGVSCAALDLTDRKQAELELAEKQRFIENITNAIPDTIYIYDLERKYNVYCNRNMVKNFGFNASQIQQFGCNLLAKLVHPDDLEKVREYHKDFQDKKDDEITEIEYRIRDLRNNWHWIISHDKIFTRNQHGKVTQIIGIASDITEKKEVELAIQKSLAEKEILLKEIHHRVKNNLYVISSLLNLQANYFDDAEVLKAFINSQNRIQSMAMIHEKLYQSNNLAEVDFGDYLTQLVNSLFNTYNPYPETIKCLIFVEPINLNIETAVPCGLLVNEIITNALKHAFNLSHQGYIKVELYHDERENINLIISDNGQGLEPNLNLANSESLGLKLVNILVEQIDAQLTINTQFNQGTTYHFMIY